jgi:hypothetical protein
MHPDFPIGTRVRAKANSPESYPDHKKAAEAGLIGTVAEHDGAGQVRVIWDKDDRFDFDGSVYYRNVSDAIEIFVDVNEDPELTAARERAKKANEELRALESKAKAERDAKLAQEKAEAEAKAKAEREAKLAALSPMGRRVVDFLIANPSAYGCNRKDVIGLMGAMTGEDIGGSLESVKGA